MTRRSFLLPLLLGLLAASAPAAHAQGTFRVGYSADSTRQAPLTVTFTATFPAAHTVRWAFGDGAAAQGPQVTHTYYRPGTFMLTATLLNAQGREVSRAETPIEVRSGGPERAELTVLHALGSVRIGPAGSVLYRPQPPRVFLDGREVGPGPAPLTPGPHAALAQATGSAGQRLERRLTLNAAPFQTSAAFDSEVLRLTNRARAQGWNCAALRAGGPALPPLKLHPALDLAAQGQSAGMALYGYFDHTSALDGSSPMRRVQTAGLSPSSVAENIAAGQTSPDEVVNGWLRSPGHCRNIMGDFTLIGLSYVSRPGTTYKHYWTQVFARP